MIMCNVLTFLLKCYQQLWHCFENELIFNYYCVAMSWYFQILIKYKMRLTEEQEMQAGHNGQGNDS